ncbi:hypothetical protein FNF27_07005 [Cafeteria roenbergensis]|uniref:Peptidase M16C associated domain-containing protein n=2 Tax=Cafeteria roenbergensis TaxID=33653 RepID=A0A5A8DV23_CAFRO|nr:hypothetical protein FNF27_07005 [Cafeteria roenbergensis]
MSSKAPVAATSPPAPVVDAVPQELLSRFRVVKREFLKEHAAWAVLLEHAATGAQLVSIEAPSAGGGDEKVFGIAFPTEPSDSTGVAHILEHSVLCGSERYPCKEPFAELLRSSQQTFLNAMTYPDRTVYPVASLNEQDFRNLVGVYLDAVFRPRLSPWTLMQEGWRLEPSEEDKSRFKLSGVVYSEMKGVYSSADSLHAMACGQALFPGQSYGVSSGGDPAAIPSLSYADFVGFHRRNYQPSKARLFFWGDDDVAERLRVVDEYLTLGNIHDEEAHANGAGDPLPSGWKDPQSLTSWWPPGGARTGEATAYSPASPSDVVDEASAAAAAAAAPWTEPRTIRVEYPAAVSAEDDAGADAAADAASAAAEAAGEDSSGHFVTVCWALPDGGVGPGDADYVSDADRLGLQLVSALLLGTRTAPLHKALVDSAMGTAVTGGGLATHLRQGVFEAGLKGVWPAAVGAGPEDDQDAAVQAAVQSLVMDTLAATAAAGFDADHVEAELNTLEFAVREFGAGGTPKGLSLFLGAAGSWIYGRDPIDEMKFEDALAELRGRVEADAKGYLSGLMQRFLLDNKHRVTVHSAPSRTLSARLNSAEEAGVASVVSGMTPEDQAVAAEAAAALSRRQATPDTEQALASVPVLTRDALRRDAVIVPREERLLSLGDAGRCQLLAHALPGTNGIAHVAVSLDLGARLPAHLVQWLPLFAQLLTTTGSATRDDVQMSHRIGAATGGVSASAHASPVPGRRDVARLSLTVGGKALNHRVGDLAAIMQELLLTAPLAARQDLLRSQVRESVAATESALLSAGHRHAMSVLGATLSFPGELAHVMGGLPQLRFLRQLRARLESKDAAVAAAAAAEAQEVMEAIRGMALAAAASDAAAPGGADSGALATVVAGEDAAAAAGDAVCAVLRALAEQAPAAGLPGSGAASPSGVVGVGHSVSASLSPMAAMGLAGGFAEAEAAAAAGEGPRRVAVLVPTSVSYVCEAGIGFASPGEGVLTEGPEAGGAPLAAPAESHVASSLLSLGHLWDSVRVQGNAYGAGAAVDAVGGSVSFWSYRDPRIGGTLRDYATSSTWLRAGTGGSDPDAVDRATISAVGGMDKPASPSDKGSQSTSRWLLGITDEQVQARRDAVLGASPQSAAELADAIDQARSGTDGSGHVCVVTGKDIARAEGIIGADGKAAPGWQVVDAFKGERA